MSRVLERPGGPFGFFRRWMHGSRELADDFIAGGIEDWAAESHISDAEMRQLKAALDTPEVAAVTANLGAHFAMSVPAAFPAREPRPLRLDARRPRPGAVAGASW